MRQTPKRTGIVRCSEDDQARSVVKTSESELDPKQLGKFCAACNKFHSYMRQSDKLCFACTDRYKKLYGVK